jgi:hypothetical protein
MSPARLATIIETTPTLTGVIKSNFDMAFVHSSALNQLRKDEKINIKSAF